MAGHGRIIGGHRCRCLSSSDAAAKVYEIIPQIAEDIGLQPDEFGDYPFRYHTALLGMYGIYAPGHFLSSDLPKLALALGLVMVASMAVFAYIIRGAFSILRNAR